MKKLNFSLVLIVVLSTLSTSNANSLEEALSGGKISGELKSQYFQKKNNSSKTSSIWTNGVNLSYITGKYNGFSTGLTFQSASVGSDNLDSAYTTAFDYDQKVSGSVLSQAYVQYKIGKTTAKVGRQYISTPLIAGSSSRIFKQSFQGIVVTSTDFSDTNISFIYADKYQNRTDGSGGAPSFNRLGDGVYSIYITNNSVKNLNLIAQYVKAKKMTTDTKDFSIYYLNAGYNFGIFKLGVQYYASDDNNTTDTTFGISNRDGNAYALEASTNISNLSLGVSYSEVSKDGGINAWQLGSGADYIYTWTWIYGGVYATDTKATKLNVRYKFSDKFSANILHAKWKTANSGNSIETDYIVDYSIVKNLSVRFMYATLNDNANYGKYHSRVYISYKF